MRRRRRRRGKEEELKQQEEEEQGEADKEQVVTDTSCCHLAEDEKTMLARKEVSPADIVTFPSLIQIPPPHHYHRLSSPAIQLDNVSKCHQFHSAYLLLLLLFCFFLTYFSLVLKLS